jgi:hypothetical protein
VIIPASNEKIDATRELTASDDCQDIAAIIIGLKVSVGGLSGVR